MEYPIDQLLKKLLLKNEIRIHQKELSFQLKSHPSYPSLHALTGVLNHFQINNLALQLPANPEIVAQLPKSFMARLSGAYGEQLVLTEKRENEMLVDDGSGKAVMIPIETWVEQWDGITLLIEKNEAQNGHSKGAPDQEWIPWLGGVLICLILALLWQYGSWFAAIHSGLTGLGLWLSMLIVQHDLGMHSSVTQRFCQLSEETSCDAVLNSNGAQLFGFFKLSDLCMTTFLAYTFYWFLLLVSASSNVGLILVATLAAFPFTLYSLYYQHQVVGKWCPICLGVVGVLLSQMVSLILADLPWAITAIERTEVLWAGMSIAAAVLFWHRMRALLQRKNDLEQLAIKHYQFTRNFTVFQSLYQQSDVLLNVETIPGEIALGKQTAPLSLLLVTSPYCFYCKQAHSDIEQLLRQLPEQIKVIIRFNASTEDASDERYLLMAHLLKLYHESGQSALEEALHEVYQKDADLPAWIKTKNVQADTSYDAILNQQQQWCLANQVNFTPALYLNGRQYPMAYDRTELVYFIDDLLEKLPAKDTEIARPVQQ